MAASIQQWDLQASDFFQNLVIGIMNGDKFELIIASLCILLEDETAEKQVEGIYNKVSLHWLYNIVSLHWRLLLITTHH